MTVTLLVARIFVTKFIKNDANMVDVERSYQEKTIVGCDVKNLAMLEDFA
jgi:hypothetical protein